MIFERRIEPRRVAMTKQRLHGFPVEQCLVNLIARWCVVIVHTGIDFWYGQRAPVLTKSDRVLASVILAATLNGSFKCCYGYNAYGRLAACPEAMAGSSVRSSKR